MHTLKHTYSYLHIFGSSTICRDKSVSHRHPQKLLIDPIPPFGTLKDLPMKSSSSDENFTLPPPQDNEVYIPGVGLVIKASDTGQKTSNQLLRRCTLPRWVMFWSGRWMRRLLNLVHCQLLVLRRDILKGGGGCSWNQPIQKRHRVLWSFILLVTRLKIQRLFT